ncbi:MAG TPA: TolC family protein [Bacteroidales bacterium]
MKKLLLFSMIAVLSLVKINAQNVKRLTFEEVIKLAEVQSPNALMAKHRFRASYWQYRTFIAQYRPSLTLTGTTPDYSNALDRVYDSQSETWIYRATNTMNNIGSLSLAQNIGLTGGSISLNSDLTLYNDIQNTSRKYITSPISIGLNQPIFRYNALKWQRKTEPLKYQAAMKTYVAGIENVHQSAVQNFFSLALAQINKQIAAMNYLNADTLWQMAQGRYNLGTIAEDELLQMQLSWLNAETARKEAEMNLRDREIRLRSFLGYTDPNLRLELVIPSEIPSLQVTTQEVYDLAMANNPDILNQQLTLLNAQSSLAQAKGERGFKATLTASFGLRDQDWSFSQAYANPSQTQRVRLGFTLPILDWGLGRGKVKMAQSSLELAQVQSNQAVTDFAQNLYLDVEMFNLQASQVGIAAKSDTVAQKMFEVTKQRFMIGKIAVLELNNADTKKDENRRAYVQSLQNYWNYFYNLRYLTLFDFILKKPLEANYDELLK